ncbi:hypothetical protein MFIFM68171_01667 [Madurella fahalii]|uniref:Uncharacterized protein n=1 Tax=Madurella fahalii TaxID=1157608 RepID=A0ABQ0G136_9PEZI
MSKKQLEDALKGQRFKLGTFTTISGTTRYGIMPVTLEEQEEEQGKQGLFSRARRIISAGNEKLSFLTSWELNQLFADLVFGALLLGLLGLSLAALAHVDRPDSVFRRPLDITGTWLKILFALLGIIISAYWGRLFQDAQTLTPYRTLHSGPAPPAATILLSRHTSPVCAVVPLLRTGHLVAAGVAAIGVASEFLIVALAGLPYRAGRQLRAEFVLCAAASAAILSLMLAQLALVVRWRCGGGGGGGSRSPHGPHLPRRPDAIAAVMTYVADTEMARGFDGLDPAGASGTTRERDRAICRMGKAYAYGWRREKEGRVRWVVDEAGDYGDVERKGFLDGPEERERDARMGL